ncbi:hypothetical protein EON66_11140 [archaeon]|nr:MAG: hypothetical protein EON66_11140 [archaeon]
MASARSCTTTPTFGSTCRHAAAISALSAPAACVHLTRLHKQTRSVVDALLRCYLGFKRAPTASAPRDACLHIVLRARTCTCRCSSKQETVYTDLARPIVDQAMRGYNGTIFAYGQTGMTVSAVSTAHVYAPMCSRAHCCTRAYSVTVPLRQWRSLGA